MQYEYFIIKGVWDGVPGIEITGDATITSMNINEISALGTDSAAATINGFNMSGNSGKFINFVSYGRCSGVNVYGVNQLKI